MLAILTFLAGAKRWLTKETAHAVATASGVVVVAIAVFGAVAAIYGAGGAASEARVNWRWLYKITQANAKHAKEEAEVNARAAAAAAEELGRVMSELDAVRDARLALEREIAALKDNPQIYSLDERRRLFKP